MLTPDQVLVVGRVSAVHGVKGWVKIHSYTDPIDNIFDYRPWHLLEAGVWTPVKLAGKRRQGKGIVAGVDGISDRDQAQRQLVGRDIAVPREQIPAAGDGEFYWRELIGLRVRLEDGRDLGCISELLETGANDVLVVRGDSDSLDQRERLLPWLPGEVVLDVALDRGEMRVDWDPDF